MHTVCCVEPGMVIDSAGGTAFIPAGAITNAMLANMPANTVKVNATGAPASPQDLLINEANLLGRETGSDLAALTAAQARGVIDFNVQVPIAYGLVTEEPTGFPLDFTTHEIDRQSSILDFIDGTRTFSIQPTGVDFTFFQIGVEYTSTGDTVVIPNTVGLHYIYYDLGILYSTIVPNIAVIYSLVFVAVVYWDGASSLYLGEERHGSKMDGASHVWMHQSRGTLYLSGLALANFAYSGGAVDASAQFSVDGGTIKDEDVLLTLTTPGASTVGLPVMYKSGAGVWNLDAPTGFSVRNTGSGRVAWNEFTGGVWQQTESATNTYVLAHVFAINIDADTYAGANYYHLVAIQGEANYSNKNDAAEGAATEINDLVEAGLPFAEFVTVASVIYNTRDSYTNAVKAIIEQPEAGVDYVDWRFSRVSPTTTPGSHNNLSDRDAPGSHPGLAIDDVLLLDGSRVMLGDLDMNEYGLTNIEYVDFNITPAAISPQEGRLWWNATDHTMNMGTETITVIQVAQEQVLRSTNNTGSTILDGKPVIVTGAISQRPTIALGQADSFATSEIIGIVTHDILNSAVGYVTTFGLVRDINTSSWADGAILWLDASVAGDFTITRPDAPNTSVFVARVVYSHATDGVLNSAPVVIPRLSWLSDVNIRGTESDQDMIWWDVANLRWDNVAASSSPGASQAVVVTDANGSVAFDTTVLVVDATTDIVSIGGNINIVNDGAKLTFGVGADGEIYSSSDDLYIKNVTLNRHIYINVNDGGVDKNVIFIEGQTGDVGFGTQTPSQPIHVYKNENDQAYILAQNADAVGSSAVAGFNIQASTAQVNLLAHGAGRVSTRYGITLANYCDIAATAGNGLLIGTGSTAAPVIFGTNSVERMRIGSAGVVYINDTANTFMTQGLTINQGANDDEILSLKSSDIDHGMTGLAETDTYVTLGKITSGSGGLLTVCFGEGTIGMRQIGYYGDDTTTKAAASTSVIQFQVAKKSGTTFGNIATGQNIFGIQGRIGGVWRNVALFAEDGDLYLDTVVNEDAWDEYDDEMLLHGLRASLMPDGHELRKRFGEWIAFSRPILDTTGVVTYNDDGHHFIATKKLQMLTIDALRQSYELIHDLESRLKILEVANGYC